MQPAGPRKMLILLGSLIVGLFAGVVAALLFDGTSDRIRDPQQIERELGLPVLAQLSGTFKDIEVSERQGSLAAKRVPFVLASPSSKETTEIRAVRNSVVLTEGAKTVVITSDCGGGGVLRVAVNLAVLLAHSGARVLLVDTDLQKPRVQDEFGVDNGPGLGDFLAGDSAAPTPVRPIPDLEKLHLVTGGRSSSNSPDLLSSTALRTLLLNWKKEFDYVVLAGTPLLVSNVGVPLASWADATVLVVQNGESRLQELKKIRDTLVRHKARIHGVVINKAPRRAMNKAAQREEARYVFLELAKQNHGD